MNINRLYFRAFAAVLFALVFSISVAQAQTAAFTYQGQLNDGATAASGTYNMQFSLFDAATNGNQIGSTITNTTVSVLNGIFTVQLDFSASTPFSNGANRFLQITVKKPADANYTTLTPRQQITSSPYSIRTLNAGTSDALSTACVGCVTDAQIAAVAGSKVTGTVANATNATTAATATNAGNVTGTVAIATGGTGATTAANARTNLGLGTLATVTPTGTASATTFLRGDNTYAAIPSSGGAPIFSTLANAVTVNSSTFVDIVSLNLEANKIYYFDGSIYGQRAAAATANGAGNFRLTYTGSATTDIGIENSGSLVPGTVFNATSFDYEAANFFSTFTMTNSRRYNPTGFIRTTTAGTLTFKVARGAANTTIDLVVREGSFFRATPLN